MMREPESEQGRVSRHRERVRLMDNFERSPAVLTRSPVTDKHIALCAPRSFIQRPVALAAPESLSVPSGVTLVTRSADGKTLF